jgi:hypothetical protein
MRKSLILALGLIGISFISLDLLTGPASADNKVISPSPIRTLAGPANDQTGDL